MTEKVAFKKGNCEASHFDGGGVDVRITLVHPNMWLCDTCLAEEKAAILRSQKVVEHARKVDTDIEVKADLFNAGTVPFVEISAAVQSDSSIPDTEKGIQILTLVAERIEKLSEAIFSEKAATAAKEHQRYALQINAQKLASTLHEKDREKFKQFDINYKPTKVVKGKTPKPTPVSTKKFDKNTLYEMAKKYGVPANQVQSIVVRRNISYEDAAKELAKAMGLTD
jgi:LysM repeat protein